MEEDCLNVTMDEIAENDHNLNISRYISTALPEPEIDLGAVHTELQAVEDKIIVTKRIGEVLCLNKVKTVYLNLLLASAWP